MRMIKFLISVFAIILISSTCLNAKENNSSKKDSNITKNIQKKEYPTFTLKDMDGKSYEIKAVKWGLTFPSLKDKKFVAVLMFGEHCPPCLKEIPNLVDLKKKYKKDFEILALQVQKDVDKKSLENLRKKYNINYPIIKGRDYMDFIYYFAKKSGWLGSVPYILIFDKEGHIKFSNLGYTSKEAIESVFKVKKKADSSENKK